MKRFKIEQSNADIISHAGLALIGQAINRHTHLSREIDTQVPLRHGIQHSAVIKSYLAMLCLGKNDFEAINGIESEDFFLSAMDIDTRPSEATLRQRLDKRSERFLPIVAKANRDFLTHIQPTLTPVSTGHIPLDGDVTPMDNSRSHKQGVSRTYKGCDGYAPMPFYLGQEEGYCLAFELREGKQHCQKDTPALLNAALDHAQKITGEPLLLRLDGGNDAIENVHVVLEHNRTHPDTAPVDFIIKWNPRQQDKAAWLDYAEQHGRWHHPRPGKRVALFTVVDERRWHGHAYRLARIMRLTERTIDRQGQCLLTPQIELEGWWCSQPWPEEQVIELYADHGTSEQFHSEFKTDLDIERLPSGKFATNALVLTLSMLAYNLLRWIGQQGLLGAHSPKRAPVKRRRIKTVMQELIYLAARITHSARSLTLAFGRGCRAAEAFARVYHRLAYG